MNIKEVARQAKVSTATVSRTLNGVSAVAPETARKVWDAIHKLGYYPNAHAQTLVSGRSHLLGLIISDICNPFFPELVRGFQDVAIQNRYEVLIADTSYEPARMATCLRRMIERKVDGVALMTSEIDRELLEELSRRGVPTVLLDYGSRNPDVCSINVDYSQGIREAVQHLLNLKHRRIAFVSGPLALKSARTRRSAFLKEIRKCGIRDNQGFLLEANHSANGGEEAMNQLLRLSEPPTAVLCSNDLTAIGALRAIHKCGLRVPEDISLVGFDDIQFSEFTHPALTTIRLSRDELGRKAFEALHERMIAKRQVRTVIQTSLVVRESTSAVKKVNTSRRGTSG